MLVVPTAAMAGFRHSWWVISIVIGITSLRFLQDAP
jgi:hypothetical protein